MMRSEGINKDSRGQLPATTEIMMSLSTPTSLLVLTMAKRGHGVCRTFWLCCVG